MKFLIPIFSLSVLLVSLAFALPPQMDDVPENYREDLSKFLELYQSLKEKAEVTHAELNQLVKSKWQIPGRIVHRFVNAGEFNQFVLEQRLGARRRFYAQDLATTMSDEGQAPLVRRNACITMERALLTVGKFQAKGALNQQQDEVYQGVKPDKERRLAMKDYRDKYKNAVKAIEEDYRSGISACKNKYK